MTIDEIENELRTAIETKRANGWKIERGITYMPTVKSCCALGAYYNSGQYIYASRELWGVSTNWAPSFADGFDGDLMRDDVDDDAYALGRRLAREYVDGVK